jgi:hypothetical protein
METTWKVLTVVLLIWTVTTLLQAAYRGLRPREFRPSAEAVGVGCAIAGVLAASLFFGLAVRPVPALAAAGAGLVLGYLSSRFAGFEDDYGDIVLPGSAWFLVPWGVSAGVTMFGAVGAQGLPLALGLVGFYASSAAGVGQFAFGLEALGRVSRGGGRPENEPVLAAAVVATSEATEVMAPPPEPVAVEPPAPATSETASIETASCPTCGVSVRAAARFCRACGGQLLCSNGHRVTAHDARFCAACGEAVGPTR